MIKGDTRSLDSSSYAESLELKGGLLRFVLTCYNVRLGPQSCDFCVPACTLHSLQHMPSVE